jgi:ABC-2 type transport system ATP-binding protein
MPHAISCRNLHKRFPQKPKPVDAVNGIDLDIQIGECFGLLGPNGAGKTTTVEMFQGLVPPTEGTIEVLGLRWGTNDQELRHRIGTSLQQTRFPDRLTVLEVARLFRSFYREGKRPEDLLETVDLTEKASARVDRLSGGQLQRLAVACALAGEPELLFLDEPTTGLDPQSRRHLWELIRGLRAQGRTVLLTTHYMEEAERLCDRVGVVDHGKLIALGRPQELIQSLGGEHVLEFSLEGQNGADSGADGETDWSWLPSFTAARCETGGFVVTVGEIHRAVPALLRQLERVGRTLARLTTRHATLEDVFVKLTGRHIAD